MSEEPIIMGDPVADQVAEALRSFRPIRNPLLQWAVDVLPLGVIAFVIVDALLTRQYVADNPMFLTGLLAAALAAFLFRALLKQVPETLGRLWARDVLEPRSTTFASRKRMSLLFASLFDRLPAPWRGRQLTPAASHPYQAFVADFEDWLNHRLSWAAGLFFAAIMYVSFPFRLAEGWTFNWMRWMLRYEGWLPLLGSLSQVATAYVLGLLVWRMIVIAANVYRLGQVFDFDIQVQHPDKSGGLKPLGDLCFSNALIITVPGIFLAGWIMAISNFGWEEYASWEPFYRQLLLVIFILALLAFFQPLYGVHQAMVRQRARIGQRLDELSRRIDELAKVLLEDAESMGTERGQELSKELSLLRQVYESNSTIPVWPFDKTIILKLLTSQTVPLLSLTGAGSSAVKLVEVLLKLVQP